MRKHSSRLMRVAGSANLLKLLLHKIVRFAQTKKMFRAYERDNLAKQPAPTKE